MARQTALRISAGILLFMAVHGTGYSAEIQETDNRLCAFKLEGMIAAGDAEKFAQLIRRNLSRIDEFDTRTHTVCLRSIGGMYIEALKISDLLYGHGISTVIEDGSHCFSACAIIFMAGVASDKSGPILPLRMLSAGGILGFHAPYMSMPDEKYSKEQVDDIAQGMRMGILGLMQLSSKKTFLTGHEFLKKSLIQKILEKGPQDAFFVTRVFDAARWDIDIYDAEDNFRIDVNQHRLGVVENVCKNFHYANIDEEVPRDLSLSVRVEKYSSKLQKDDGRILIYKHGTYDPLCELYPKQLKGMKMITFLVCSFDYRTHRNFGDCREYKTSSLMGQAKFVPTFFALAPETRLKKFQN